MSERPKVAFTSALSDRAKARGYEAHDRGLKRFGLAEALGGKALVVFEHLLNEVWRAPNPKEFGDHSTEDWVIAQGTRITYRELRSACQTGRKQICAALDRLEQVGWLVRLTDERSTEPAYALGTRVLVHVQYTEKDGTKKTKTKREDSLFATQTLDEIEAAIEKEASEQGLKIKLQLDRSVRIEISMRVLKDGSRAAGVSVVRAPKKREPRKGGSDVVLAPTAVAASLFAPKQSLGSNLFDQLAGSAQVSRETSPKLQRDQLRSPEKPACSLGKPEELLQEAISPTISKRSEALGFPKTKAEVEREQEGKSLPRKARETPAFAVEKASENSRYDQPSVSDATDDNDRNESNGFESSAAYQVARLSIKAPDSTAPSSACPPRSGSALVEEAWQRFAKKHYPHHACWPPLPQKFKALIDHPLIRQLAIEYDQQVEGIAVTFLGWLTDDQLALQDAVHKFKKFKDHCPPVGWIAALLGMQWGETFAQRLKNERYVEQCERESRECEAKRAAEELAREKAERVRKEAAIEAAEAAERALTPEQKEMRALAVKEAEEREVADRRRADEETAAQAAAVCAKNKEYEDAEPWRRMSEIINALESRTGKTHEWTRAQLQQLDDLLEQARTVYQWNMTSVAWVISDSKTGGPPQDATPDWILQNMLPALETIRQEHKERLAAAKTAA